MAKTLLVGIDVSSTTQVIALAFDEGTPLGKPFALPNSPQGAHALEERLLTILQTHGLEALKIATEATGFLDLHLVDFLATSERLAPYAPSIYQLNPKLVRGFKAVYPDKDKTDRIDAQVILDRLRFGHLPEPYEAHQPYLPLRRLTRHRFHLVQTLAREQTYFWSHLFLKFSGLATQNPFQHPFTATCQALLEEFFSPDELVQTSEEHLVEFLIQHGNNRFRDPQALAQAVQQAARESYRLRPALAASVHLILASIVQTLRALRASLKKIDAAIAKEFAAFPNTLQSIPGIGPVYAAGIFAEIGHIGRFPSHAHLAKFAGLTWRQHQSGTFTAQCTRMTKSGNAYLRYYLVEAANSLRVHNAEYKAFYQKKYQEVTRYQHKRALALTARKLVRLVFALLAKGQLYQYERSQ